MLVDQRCSRQPTMLHANELRFHLAQVAILRKDRGRGRECDDECGALAGTGALGADGAAVQFDEMPRERESKPQAAELARDARIGLPETLKHKRKMLARDPYAGISHFQPHR